MKTVIRETYRGFESRSLRHNHHRTRTTRKRRQAKAKPDEPAPGGKRRGTDAWPNITISTGGQWTTLVSRPSPETASSLFRYSGAGAAVVPAADLESAIDEFAAFIMNRMDAAGLPDTNLHLLRQDLQSERNDPEKARFRRLEARLGYDPDEPDADETERLGRNRQDGPATEQRR